MPSQHASGTITLGSISDAWTTLNTPTPETTQGTFQFWFDLNALLAGDTYEARLTEKVISSAGAAREVFRMCWANAQAKVDPSPALILLHGWDLQVRQRTGTVKAIPWSIRKV